MKSVALNIGANSDTPGGRGPIYADGSFEYVPISESDDTVTGPTFIDLGLDATRPDSVSDTAVHFDPEFPEYSFGEEYSYGDRHSPKIDRIAELEQGDVLFFYATLDYTSEGEPQQEWINRDWGAYVIGHFTLERDPVSKEEYKSLPQDAKDRFRNNAHVRRESFDAEYLVLGDPDESRLYRTPVPLSGETGTEANEFVTVHSSDSGGGPWYRRPLKFDEGSTERLLEAQKEYQRADPVGPAVHSRTEIDRSELGGKGQLQFFYHAAGSDLPVRDIPDRGKTEPHIEKRAENYCNECYQPNIRGFLNDSDRRYLLLFTRCRNRNLNEAYGQRHVVGYIDKEEKLDMGDHLAVRGRTRLVSFEDAVPLADVVDSPKYVRVKILDGSVTEKLVSHLDEAENRLEDCLAEVQRFKDQQSEGDVPPPTEGGC